MGGKVYRLSKEDLAVCRFIERYAKKLENPGFELYVMGGLQIRVQRKVCQWIEAVSTRNARRRRQDILDQFIANLCRQYPLPEKNEGLGAPPNRNRGDDNAPRRLTKEKREARLQKRPAKEESDD